MTVPATTRRVGPFYGNGAATSFPFYFECFTVDDFALTLTDPDGFSDALTRGVDYNVTLNADQASDPGGTVTYPISGAAMASGYTLVGVGALAYDQTTSFPAGGSYRAQTHERAFDRTVYQIQQLAEELGRSLTLPPSAAEADTTLPAPTAFNVIGWNADADALVNYAPSELATVVVAGTSYTDVFTPTALQTQFALTADPGSVNALDVALYGVPQINGTDFTVSGTTLTMTTAPGLPPSPSHKLVVRYVAAVPVGSANAQDVVFDPTVAYPAGTVGWGVRFASRGLNALRHVPPTMWAAILDGTSTDDHTAYIQTAINAASNSMETEVFLPAGRWNSTTLYCVYDAALNPGYNANRDGEVWLNGQGMAPENGGSCGSVLNFTNTTGYGLVVAPAGNDATYNARDFRATGISFQGSTSDFLVLARGVVSIFFDNCEFIQTNAAGSALWFTTSFFGTVRRCRFQNRAGGTKTGDAIKFGSTLAGGLLKIEDCNFAGYGNGFNMYAGIWQNLLVSNSEVYGTNYDFFINGTVEVLNCESCYFEGVKTSFIKSAVSNGIKTLNMYGCWGLGSGLTGPGIDLDSPNTVNIVGGHWQDQDETFLNITGVPSGGRANHRVIGMNFPRTSPAASAVVLFTGVLPTLEGIDYASSDPNVTLYTATATSGFPVELWGLIGNATQLTAGGLGVNWVKSVSVAGGATTDQTVEGFPRAIVVTQSGASTLKLSAIAVGLPHGTLTLVKNAATSTGNLTVQRNGGTTLATLAPGDSGWFLLDLRSVNDWV
jgi:hypothetical protein